ncbi:MAG: hypothetical protein AABX10_04210 [Nanoarchaeota archaeon]
MAKIELIDYTTSLDGSLWSALEIGDEKKRKVMLYRVGIVGSKETGGTRYLHEVADVSFPRQVLSWRRIDSKRDYGFSPQVFRDFMKNLRK